MHIGQLLDWITLLYNLGDEFKGYVSSLTINILLFKIIIGMITRIKIGGNYENNHIADQENERTRR